jgi:diguanylate cyclase (GGDEF)-like protein/PAS domain S-box-containing protein
MNKEIMISLIENIAILISVVFLYTLFIGSKLSGRLRYRLALGLLNGCIGILLMWTALRLDNGVIFDARSILIGVSGLFFGFVPTVVSGAIMLAYRFFLAGPGVYAGVAVILTTCILGILGNRILLPRILAAGARNNLRFLSFGLLVHVDMLLCMTLLPESIRRATLETIAFPVLILYPIGTFLLCRLLMSQINQNALSAEIRASQEKYQAIAESTSDLIWTADEGLRLTYVSPSVTQMFGLSAEAYAGQNWKDMFPPEDHDRMMAYFIGALESSHEGKAARENGLLECRQRKGDGTLIWVSVSISPIRDGNGRIAGFSGITRDIDRLKKSELEQNRQQALMASILESISDSVFYKDTGGTYQGCNQAFADIVGYSKEEIIGRTDEELFPGPDAEKYVRTDRKIMAGHRTFRVEDWVSFPDGTRVLLETLKTPYWTQSGELGGIIGISRDMTDRYRKEEEIQYLAYHDFLTGLYNRRFYEEELSRLDVERNLPLSIVMGDVNGLKLVNDSFGHQAGDELLKTIARIIKAHCRADDILARYGGDEFVLLLPRTGEEQVLRILSRINRTMAGETVSGLEVSISFGFCTKTASTEDLEAISGIAEDNMYKNKLTSGSSVRSKSVDIIMNTLYEKNHREMMHSKRVSRISGGIARALGLGKEQIEKAALAGLVHDIGKIGIDEHILNSAAPLSPEDWAEIRRHPEIGYRILMPSEEFGDIATSVLEHQERWDGSGYPKGLAGLDISLEARIIALADAYDAMTGNRPYGRVFSRQEALDEIAAQAGRQFDPDLAELFLRRWNQILESEDAVDGKEKP